MTKKRAPHRHHYIPRMILRNFANEDGGLWFWRRGFPIGEVKITTPENLFLEDDLYTLVDDSGERDVSVERWFSGMEAAGAHFLRQLLDIVRSGKKPRLEEDVWEFLHLFRYYLDKRSAAWHSRFVSRDELLSVVQEIAMQPQWSEDDRSWLNDIEDLDRIMRNARIMAQTTGPTDELLSAMRDRGLAIYVSPPKASFLLGDHPTAMAKVGQAAPQAYDGKVSFMPISSDVAIGYFSLPHTVHIEHLTRSQIRTMNEAMARQSVMIAGKSQSLVSSLSRVGYATPAHFTTSDHLFG